MSRPTLRRIEAAAGTIADLLYDNPEGLDGAQMDLLSQARHILEGLADARRFQP